MDTEKEVVENVETLKKEKQNDEPKGELVAVERRYYINQEFSDK